MLWTCCKILLLFHITEWEPVECRLYDVYAESFKLYGEDLTMVLKRFRRTPEYLSILMRKVNELKDYALEVTTQARFAYQGKVLEDRINETLNEVHNEKETPKPGGALRSSDWLQLQLADEEQNANNVTTLSPVEILDSHVLLHSDFTVSERNLFRDVGFEVAGSAIHKMIESMGPEEDETEQKSTRMPQEAARTRAVTEHAKKHAVKQKTAILRNNEAELTNTAADKPEAR